MPGLVTFSCIAPVRQIRNYSLLKRLLPASLHALTIAQSTESGSDNTDGWRIKRSSKTFMLRPDAVPGDEQRPIPLANRRTRRGTFKFPTILEANHIWHPLNSGCLPPRCARFAIVKATVQFSGLGQCAITTVPRVVTTTPGKLRNEVCEDEEVLISNHNAKLFDNTTSLLYYPPAVGTSV